MPLINGCKYSCEPCIRGHRATSCAHTDRILIEVRKPGRPLESCGHNLNTCQCGRLAESFIVGDVLPNPAAASQGSEPDLSFIVTTPPSTVTSRRPSRSGGKSKISKKTSRKKSETTPASSSSVRNRGSRETSTLNDENETDSYETSTSTSSPGIQEQNFVFQQQQQGAFSPPPPPFQQDTPYLPPIGTYFPPMQNEYLQYQNTSGYGLSPPSIQYPYGTPLQQQYQGPSREYSSRVENVSRAPSEQQAGGESGVRSPYIVATSDNVWRAPQ